VELRVEDRSGIAVVQVSDDITTEAIHDFSTFLKTEVTPKFSRIVLDMACVDYFCSSAYGVMLRALEAARAAGGDLVLANASESVIRLFEVTRLTSVVRMEQDVDSAIRFFERAKK